MESKRRTYIHALGYDRLTGLYDWLVSWTAREATFKKSLVQQIEIAPADSILDVGCGTGTLMGMIKNRYPRTVVFGIDGDQRILVLAKKKSVKTNQEFILTCGMSYSFPYPDESFDMVISSLLFHHLTKEEKLQTLDEARRVLIRGGELYIGDWGKPQNQIMRAAFFTIQLLDGFATTRENVQGLLPQFIRDRGFDEVQETTQLSTMYGTLAVYHARRPF